MVIANPRVHVICGACGSNEYMKFETGHCGCRDCGCEKTGGWATIVTCGNCFTLTHVDELNSRRKD